MPPQRFKGQSGVIEIYEDRVELRRERWRNKFAYRGDGDKQIQKVAVTGIETDKGGLTKPAHITIQEMGYQTTSGSAIMAPMGENSVAFGDTDTWEKAVVALKEWLSTDNDPSQDSVTEDSAKAKLRETFASGEISEEEYRERLSVLEETE